MEPELIGLTPEGLGIFRAPDGSVVHASLEHSPYAAELATRARAAPTTPAAPAAPVAVPTPSAVPVPAAPAAPAASPSSARMRRWDARVEAADDALLAAHPEAPREGVPPMLARTEPAVPPMLARPPAPPAIIPGTPRLAGSELVSTDPAGWQVWRRPDGTLERVERGSPDYVEPTAAEIGAATRAVAQEGVRGRRDTIAETLGRSTAAPVLAAPAAPRRGLEPGTETGLETVVTPDLRALAREHDARASPGVPTMTFEPVEVPGMPTTVVDATGRTLHVPTRAQIGGGGRAAPGPLGAGSTPVAPTPSLPEQMLAAPDQSGQVIESLAAGAPAPRRAPDLIDRQQLVETQRADLARQDAQRQATIERQAEAQRQQVEQDRQQATQRAADSYQRAVDRVAQAHIDPGNWFRDQGAFGTIGAVIAVAMGAVGQAFSGSSSNQALDLINEAIDRDLAAQRTDLDAQISAAGMQQNMVGLMREEFHDCDAAQQAARAAMLQQAALHLQEQTADLASEEARVNADALRAQLEAEEQAAQQAAIDHEIERKYNAAHAAREMGRAMQEQAQGERDLRRLAGGGGAATRPATPTQLTAYDRLVRGGIPRAEAARQAGLPAGLVPPQATEVSADLSNAAALEDAVARLESLLPPDRGIDAIPGVGPLDSRAPEVLVSDEGLEIQRAALAMTELYGRMHSGGAISEDELDTFARILGTTPGSSERSLRTGIATARREIAARLRAAPAPDEATQRDLSEFGGSWVE